MICDAVREIDDAVYLRAMYSGKYSFQYFILFDLKKRKNYFE